MLHHSAYGRAFEALTVAVVDNRQPMLAMMRAMLAAIGVGRIETYAGPADALKAMSSSEPDLVIAAAAMEPLTGPELVRTMRHVDAGPLRFIPAMIMSTPTKPRLLDEALRAGAHQVLELPIAASTLCRRLDWLINDDRPYELRGGHYVVAGLEERLAMRFERSAHAPIQLPESSPLAGGAPDDVVVEAMPFPLKVRAAAS
ncbi:MAG: response regulator [Alphaproteobacteria bacterium]|nr:response regulator [Alphaproteobacteria bacterium]